MYGGRTTEQRKKVKVEGSEEPSSINWSFLIFKLCDRLKVLPNVLTKSITQKELYFLFREIQYTEKYEMCNKLKLAGAKDPDSWLRQEIALLDSIYYPVDEVLPDKSLIEESINQWQIRQKKI